MKGAAINYSEAELEFLSCNRVLRRRELHAWFCYTYNRFDVSLNNVKAVCKRNGWMTGRTGCYAPGCIPHPDARPRGPNKTSFKRGNRPHNWLPVGSTRVTRDGYSEVKVAEPRTWRQLHLLMWEKAFGTVPDGFCVSFIDGDSANVALDNLELISRNANLQINRLRYSSRPDLVKPAIKTLGKLIAKTIESERGLGGVNA